MLITFKSKVAADIIMYETHAAPFLEQLGKNTKQGIITAAECPHAAALLEKQIIDSRASEKARQAQEEDLKETDPDAAEKLRQAAAAHVSFAARFFPLLEMLQAASKKGCDIVWGV